MNWGIVLNHATNTDKQMIHTLRHRQDLLPSLAIVLGAVFWGLFWIPVRAIEQSGVNAVWTGPIIFASVTAVFLPIALWRRRRLFMRGNGLLSGGILAGLAFALYALSLNLTDVVRALLLFYITPLWSTLLGIFLLKECLNVNRILALLFSFSGLITVLGAGIEFPWPREVGDWFALASGLCWSFASVRLFQGGSAQMFEKITLFVFFAFCTSVLLALLPFGIENAAPSMSALLNGWPWAAVVAVLMIPVTYLTIWPTSILSPARVGMLLMAEIVVGVASAAMLTDESFGMRETTGTLLILGAAVIEVMRQQTSRRHKPTVHKSRA